MENVRKHRDTKLVTTDKRRNYLVSEPNFHTAKFFAKSFKKRDKKSEYQESAINNNKAL